MSLSASKIEAKYGVSIFGEVISLPLSVLQSQTNQVRKLTQTLSQIRTTIIQKLLDLKEIIDQHKIYYQ